MRVSNRIIPSSEPRVCRRELGLNTHPGLGELDSILGIEVGSHRLTSRRDAECSCTRYDTPCRIVVVWSWEGGKPEGGAALHGAHIHTCICMMYDVCVYIGLYIYI